MQGIASSYWRNLGCLRGGNKALRMGKPFFLEMLKPDWLTLLLCNSQWHPSIRLIGWLSRYISDVERQNTTESFDWVRAIEAVRRFFYTTRVMPHWLSGRSILWSLPQCGLGWSADRGRITAARRALASTLLNSKMRNGTPYGRGVKLSFWRAGALLDV